MDYGFRAMAFISEIENDQNINNLTGAQIINRIQLAFNVVERNFFTNTNRATFIAPTEEMTLLAHPDTARTDKDNAVVTARARPQI